MADLLSEFWSDIRYRARALFRRDAVEHELDAELQFHIAAQTEKYERLGMSHVEAVRRARVAFGGVDRFKEESRAGRGTVLLETAVQDLRYAARGLRAHPGFTLGVVITLGLGVGANAAMFGIVDRMLFRPPAFLQDPSTVHRVYEAHTADRTENINGSVQFARYRDLTRWSHDFSAFAAFTTQRMAIGDGAAEREVYVSGVSASYFDFFNARAALGRFFTAAEDSALTGSPVAVVSFAYWQSQLGGRPDVIGARLRIDRTVCTIIGVTPEGFTGIGGGSVPAIYIPVTTFAWDRRPTDYSKNYGWHWLEVIARRKGDVRPDDATADLTAALRQSWIAARRLDARTPSLESSRPRAILAPVQVARGPLAGPAANVAAWVMGVSVIVLLIACANVANLLLARALTRRREIALRLALGVSRARLVRQLLTESVLLAALGSAAGLAVAQLSGAVLRTLFLPPDVSINALTDTRTLGVLAIATIVVALLTGATPAFEALRYDLSRTLNAAGRDVASARSRLRTALLVVQATLSVVLLVGAGLFVRSLVNVRRLRLGYDVAPIIAVTDNTRGEKWTTAERSRLEDRLVETATATPGVVAATPATSIPFWAFDEPYLFVTGIDSVSTLGDFLLQAGNPALFRTLGTRILRGRGFTDGDRANAPRVTVVSAGMAAALWPGQPAIGKCVRIGADTAPCSTVVGIAEDAHANSLDASHDYTYYVPVAQFGGGSGMLLVRVAGEGEQYLETVRRSLQRIMPGASYVTTTSLSEIVDPQMQSWRSGATMFVAFGALALVLAGVGLYSVIAYGVAQRRQELGVRIALGASSRSVVKMVIGDGLGLVFTGTALGWLIAWFGGRWLAPLLFHESATDPLIYGGVALILVSVAVVAMAVPALRAARVDPSVALRAE